MELHDVSTAPRIQTQLVPGIAWSPNDKELPSLLKSIISSPIERCTTPYSSPDGVYTTPKWDENMLFDVSGARNIMEGTEGTSALLLVDLVLEGEKHSCGSVQIPIYPFVRVDGHLSTAWYPLIYRGSKVGQVRTRSNWMW